MKGRDTSYLHRVLLWSDKQSDDETFRKTALEWAVENDDRLCTTEILHQGRYIYICYHFTDTKASTLTRRSTKTVKDIILKLFRLGQMP